ncbi:MAG: SLBB domain-containing protein [Fidelibacterota bacterium]
MNKVIITILACTAIAFAAPFEDIPENNENMQQGTISMIPPAGELETEIDSNIYIVGVGDQFMIERLQDQSIITIPVSPTGVINIPGKGNVKVSGLTLKEASERIRKRVGSYINVSLYEIKKIRIPITGAVKNPGIYSISAAWRLSDLIKKVPLRYLGKDFEIHIRSKYDTTLINIYDFYLNGEEKSNPYLHAGESVYIPFADPDEECVEVYGPVMVKSFVPFIKGESLGDFYRRKVVMSDIMNYEKIVVIRNGEQISISMQEMNNFKLQAKDKIEFMNLAKIMVSGHVNRPGTYDFVPGHKVVDYISMAGGTNFKGSSGSAVVIRGSEKIRNPKNLEIKRGDIILVKRSAEDILIGEISILSFVSMLASIASTVITAFIAAGNL